MSDGKKPEVVLVQPVKGVYCELMYGDQVHKVWKVHPNTPERFGTELPYDLAVYFLGKVPPVITLVPEMKNGERITPLLLEDADKIAASVKRGFVGGLKNYNEVSKAQAVPGGTSQGSDEALKKALDLLSKQTENNKILQESVAKLQEQVDNLEKQATIVPDVPVTPAGTGSVTPAGTGSVTPAGTPVAHTAGTK